MSNKIYELYLHIFSYIKFLLEKFSIKFTLKEKFIMMNLEKVSEKLLNPFFRISFNGLLFPLN